MSNQIETSLSNQMSTTRGDQVESSSSLPIIENYFGSEETTSDDEANKKPENDSKTVEQLTETKSNVDSTPKEPLTNVNTIKVDNDHLFDSEKKNEKLLAKSDTAFDDDDDIPSIENVESVGLEEPVKEEEFVNAEEEITQMEDENEYFVKIEHDTKSQANSIFESLETSLQREEMLDDDKFAELLEETIETIPEKKTVQETTKQIQSTTTTVQAVKTIQTQEKKSEMKKELVENEVNFYSSLLPWSSDFDVVK